MSETNFISNIFIAHLQQLEAESIYIIREVVAEFDNPVMLYSIGKDSSVLVHLALKAFYPAKPPFPLLHVDTTWKFRDMIAFRDRFCRENGLDLIVYTNQEGVKKGMNPFDYGSSIYTNIMKTEALRQALELNPDRTATQSGLAWLPFYQSGDLEAVRAFLDEQPSG